MKRFTYKHPRRAAATVSTLAVVAAAAAAPSAIGAAQPGAQSATHEVIVSGLDNPRQLSVLSNGDFLIAEAGHGSYNPDNCSGSGQDAQCVGVSSKVTRVHAGQATTVVTGLLSAAGTDGTFAIGADGASQLPGGPYYAIETYAPRDQIPPGLPAKQLGWLLSADGPGVDKTRVANISAFEQQNDPDGEGFDSDPYAVLALHNKTLVADAAGDDILQVRDGEVSLWTVLQEYGPDIDPVPTTVVKGADGMIYVGELHSEIPHQAHVWQYDRAGNRLAGWGGFTTVTGVARAGDGTLYVSELFGGPCTIDQIPTCFPGRVVKVAPDGTRTRVNVPFPAGIAVLDDQVYVNAFSVSPAIGFGGNPDWTGQLWQISFN